MAKKDKKGKKDKPQSDGSDVVERVRGAVERTFQATSGGAGPARDVGRSLLDEVASAAQRIRESFDDLRVLEDVRGLRAEIEALSRRVEALEKQQTTTGTGPQVPAAAATVPPTTSKPRAKAKASASSRKPPARSRASSAGRTVKGSAVGTAAKPATSRRRPAAKPKAKAAAAKPSAAGS